MSNRKLTLLFVNDVVYPLEPMETEEEKLIDKLLKPITVKKMRTWCG